MKRVDSLASCRVVAAIDLGAFSDKLPDNRWGKFALRKLLRHSVLELMIRRLAEATQIDQVVVTGCNLPADALSSNSGLATVIDVRLPHLLPRLAAVAKQTSADWILFLPANRPFLDPVLIDSLVARARRSEACDYLGFAGEEKRLETVCQIGLAGELIHVDCLQKLAGALEHSSESNLHEHDHLAGLISSIPGSYQLRLLPLCDSLDRADLRFVIENEADLQLAETILDALGEQKTDWQSLCSLVENHTAIRELMRKQNLQRSIRSASPSKLSLSAQSN